MSRLSLDSPTLCSCLFFTTFPRSFSPAYSCSDLSCSLLSNGSMATQKDVADPSEEKLLGLEACQLQILGLETFGELREAKMMRLRKNGVRGRERSPRYWHKKRYTKWLESAELRLVPIFLAEMCLTDEIPRKYPHCGWYIPLLFHFFFLTSRCVSRPMTWEMQHDATVAEDSDTEPCTSCWRDGGNTSCCDPLGQSPN